MVSKEKIVFDEPLYYMPNYDGVIRISILKLLDGERVLVKQYSQKKDYKPFSTPIAHIYNCSKDADKGRRTWEAYKRRKSKGG